MWASTRDQEIAEHVAEYDRCVEKVAEIVHYLEEHGYTGYLEEIARDMCDREPEEVARWIDSYLEDGEPVEYFGSCYDISK